MIHTILHVLGWGAGVGVAFIVLSIAALLWQTRGPNGWNK